MSSSPSICILAPFSEAWPFGRARRGDRENGSISQRHDLRPEPSRSFSFLALSLSSHPLRSNVILSPDPWKEREGGKWFSFPSFASSRASRIGSQSEDHDMHVRLARSALGPLLALSSPLPHVFAENADFAITAPVGSVGGRRRRTPCRIAGRPRWTDEYHPERGEECE